MDRTQKKDAIANFGAKASEMGSIVAALYTGLTVADMTKLRNKARAEGAEVKVMKNTLAKIALKDTEFEAVTAYLTKQTVLIYSNDPTVPARIANDFSKENDKLVIVGGSLPGQGLDANRVKALANLPSLDQLRSQLIGLIQAPATKIACVVQAPASQLARVVNAYATKG